MTREAGKHRGKPRTVAFSLACCAVVLVFGALAAVFVPAKQPATLPLQHGGVWPWIHPTGTGSSSALSPSPSPSCCPASPAPGPAVPVAYPAPSRTYPAPTRTYPAPTRTYPAPPPSTWPAPARTYPPPPPSPTPPPGADLPPPVPLIQPMQGVVDGDVAAWNTLTHHTAQLAAFYVSIAKPLAPTFVHSVLRTAAGARPVIEITPTALGQPALSLASITAGQHDDWLTALRAQITTMGRPVVLSFAPEPNGRWYSWGLQPAAFKAAWAHVHQVIGTAGITWLWQVSASPRGGSSSTADVMAYWPGPATTDWIGLDGYYYRPKIGTRAADTFASIFGWSLSEVTALGKPVLIAETAVSPAFISADGQRHPLDVAADIADLFAGVAAHHLLGLIYFDLTPQCPPSCGTFKPDFRLANNPPALAAYIQQVASWP